MNWFDILKNRGFDNKVVEIFKQMENKHKISTKIEHWSNIIDSPKDKEKEVWIELIRTYGRENVINMLGRERFNRTSKKIMRGDKSTHRYDRFTTHITLLECYVEQGRFYVRFELKGEMFPEEKKYLNADNKVVNSVIRRPFSSMGGNKAVIEISFDHNETQEELINMGSGELARRFQKLRGGTIAANKTTQRLGGSIKIKSGEDFVAILNDGETKASQGVYTPLQLIYTRTINGYYRSVERVINQIKIKLMEKILERKWEGTPSSDALDGEN